MTRVLSLFLLALVLFVGCGKSEPTKKSSGDPFADKASKLVDDLGAGRFAAVRSTFDTRLKNEKTVDRIKTEWTTFQDANGTYKSHDEPKQVKEGILTVERVIVTTSKGTAEVRVTYHPYGTVASVFFLKAGTPGP